MTPPLEFIITSDCTLPNFICELRACVVVMPLPLGVLRHVAAQSAMRHYGAFSKMGVVGM
ncbi:hypothetical protein HanIR_Chr12g0608601 [Helianthus annuus]|nr:hypothetical protein HanIR_Chr12g0608601 [Helianthus annuus]